MRTKDIHLDTEEDIFWRENYNITWEIVKENFKNLPWYNKIQISLYFGIWLLAVIGPWYALPYLDWASKVKRQLFKCSLVIIRNI